MAAHSVTIIKKMLHEFAEHPECESLLERCLHALDYAPGMGELPFTQWRYLKEVLEDNSCPNIERIDMLYSILAIQHEE